MAQRERFVTPPSRHHEQSPPPPAFMVGQVPLDAQELGAGAVDDASKILDGVVVAAHIDPLDTPSAVDQLSVTFTTGVSGDGSAWLSLSWALVSGATSYEVRWKLHADSVYQYARVGPSAYTIYGLVPNTAYDVNIAAINAASNSSGYPGPDFAETTAKDTVAPATPASVAASAGVRSVIVSFTANTETDLDHYVIEVYSDAGLTALVKTFTGLATVWAYTGSAATEYWARVKAVDTSGNSSAWSSTVTATTALVQTADIATSAITNALIANSAVQTANIAALAVTAALIANATITTTQIAASTILGTNIAAGTVTATNIAAGTITATQIAAGTITSTQIMAGSILGSNIAGTTITAANIVSGTITATQIATGTITADRMVAATITAASGILADAVITTAKIASLAVTNAKINDLAVSKLTSETMTAAVILGGSIKTATSGIRTEIDSSGVRLYGYTQPYFRGAGVDSSGTGAVTVALPPLHLANDILIMRVSTQGNETAPTTPAGWTKKDEVATGAGTTDARLTIFWKRDSGAEAAPSLASTGHRQVAFIEAYAGCVASGDPFNVTATSTDTVSNTSASITGATTTLPNTLVVLGISTLPTTDVGGVEFQGWTNANLSAAGETHESTGYAGTNGIQILGAGAGGVAASGAYGATAVTLQQASKKAMWSGALAADIAATVNLDSTVGNGSFVGTIVGSKVYTPRMTGDRIVFGAESVGGTVGSGLTLFRSGDTEGPSTSSGLVDFAADHTFPYGAGTGNDTVLALAAIGSDANDKSSQASNMQYSEIQLHSGKYKAPIGPSAGPEIDFYLQHYNSTAALISSTSVLSILDTAGTVGFSGVHQMGDLYSANQLIQSFLGALTYPGGSSTSNTLNLTWGTAFSATPHGVTSGRGGGSETVKTLFNTTAISTTGASVSGRDVDNATPANATAIACTTIATRA